MNKKVAIIMPFYNGWNLTHSRLYELYRFVPDNCEIFLVNDASTEVDCDAGAAWWQKQASKHTIHYIRNTENLGFGLSMNRGAKLAKKYEMDVLVFLSNDVVISGDFVSQILEKSDTQKGLCLIGGEVIYFPGGWNEFEFEGKRFILPYANGWLLACTSEVWSNLKGFDPIYGKWDYEDLDLSMSATSLGYNIIALNSPFVKHLGGQTVNKMDINRLEQTKRNREIFITKWQPKFNEIFQSLEQTND